MSETEMWKDIPGYEGHYQVSALGNVRSLKGNHRNQYKNRYLKPSIHHGHKHVALCKGNAIKHYLIHQLVMLAFVGEPNGNLVWHINRIKTDCRLSNLRYISRSEMNRLTSSGPYGLPPTHAKPVAFIKEDGTRTEYNSILDLCTKEGMSKYHVQKIINGAPSEIYKQCKIEYL